MFACPAPNFCFYLHIFLVPKKSCTPRLKSCICLGFIYQKYTVFIFLSILYFLQHFYQVLLSFLTWLGLVFFLHYQGLPIPGAECRFHRSMCNSFKPVSAIEALNPTLGSVKKGVKENKTSRRYLFLFYKYIVSRFSHLIWRGTCSIFFHSVEYINLMLLKSALCTRQTWRSNLDYPGFLSFFNDIIFFQ